MADSADAMRYLATVKRQSAPPRCNPFTIVLQVLALGMIFIGLTMTIIAHWPGSTSIGENPLKIAGPILLAVGSVLFFIGIVLVCCLNKRERQRWERMINKFAASRQPGDQSSFGPPIHKPGSPFDDQPGDTSVTVPLIPGHHGGGGGGGGNGGGGRGGGGGGNGGNHNPNPNEIPKVVDPRVIDGGESSFVVEDNDDVPDPFRPTKPRKKKKSTTGSTDDLPGDDSMTEKTVITTTTTTTTVKPIIIDEGSIANETSSTRSKKKKRTDGGTDGGGTGGRGPPSSPGGSRLLVHVKAQPGATVHIHPSGGPAVAPKPAFSTYSHSTASGETDI